MKYGVRFDGENSAGTRLYDAENLLWERSSNTVVGQDDFANIAPFNIKECITQYNVETGQREVLAYKGDENWDSLVINKTGDRMIEVPCFWYSRPSKYEFIVSDSPEDGFKPSPMHYHNGVLYETVRISKYALNNDYVSQTGETPRISTNMNTFRTNLRAKGQYLMDYPTWCSLVMLMLVKYGNLDAQNTVGAGRNSGRAVIASGNTDNVLGLDGSATDLTTNESVLTLGIENFYSNVFKFIDGLYAYNANIYIKDIEEIESDPANAEELQSTYSVAIEKIPESGVNANMKNIAYDEEYDWMLFPTEYGTPNPFGDKYIVNKNFNSVVVGGSAWLGAADGLFFFMVLAVGSTGTGGGALAIEFGEPSEGDENVSISLNNLTEYDGLLRNDSNILKRNTSYNLNSIVNKGQIFLKCIVAGTTNTTTLDLTSVSVGDTLTDGTVTWEVVSVSGIPESSGSGLNFWQASTEYEVDDIVVYNNIVYKCITAHTSTSTFDDTKFIQLTYELATDIEVVNGIFGGAGV